MTTFSSFKTIALGLSLSLPSLAVFPYESFSWSGSGSVNSSIAATNTGTVTAGDSAATNAANPNGPGLAIGNPSPAQGNSVAFVTGLSTGTMTGQTKDLARLEGADPNRTVGFNIDYTVVGGTADLVLTNSNPADGGAQRFNNMRLENFSGAVTEIRFLLTYNEYIAARPGDGIGSQPMLSGVNTTGSASTFDIDMSLKDVFTLNSSGVFEEGTDRTPRASGIFGTTTAGQTDLTSTSNPNNGWKLIRSFDAVGVSEEEEVYAKGLEITVSVPTGNFVVSDVIQFSLDGQQYSNLESVPEPSTALLSLGALGLLFRRKRA